MALRGTASGYASTGASVSVTVSGIGIVAGDIIVLCGAFGGGSGQTITFPTGFTAVSGLTSALAANTSGIAIKTATGSEPSSYTVTPSANDFHTLQCRVYSGRSGVLTAVAQTNTIFGVANPQTLAITGVTAAAGDDVVCFDLLTGDSTAGLWTATASSGFANLVTSTANFNYQPAIAASDILNATAGATGTIAGTATAPAVDPAFGGYVIALAQGAGGAAFAGAASVRATGTAAATNGVRFASTSLAKASALGTLASTPFAALAGSSRIIASSTGKLTNFASVTLAGTLYTGIGSIADPYFWPNLAPTVGTVVWYDPTFITVATNGEISSTTNNCSAVVEFFDGVSWNVGVVVITAFNVGYSLGIVSASGSLTTSSGSTPLLGSAYAKASALASLSTGAGSAALASAARALSTTAGTLTTSGGAAAALAGAARALTSAAAAASGNIKIAGGALSAAHASGTLGGIAALAGGARAVSSSIASLMTVPASIGAFANVTVSASGVLTTSAMFAGGSTSVASVSGALFTVLTPITRPHRVISTNFYTQSLSMVTGPLPYGEFYSRVGDSIVYGVDWNGWLAQYWSIGTIVPAGLVVRPTAPNGYSYITVNGGQSASIEPAWPTVIGQQITDGSVTWVCQVLDLTSLEATLISAAWSAPAGITISNTFVTGQMAGAELTTSGAVVGTNYPVNCAATMSDGEVKTGQFLIKIR